LTSFVRRLVLVCLKFKISFKARHIPGFKNKLAVAHSRLQIDRFKELAPSGMDVTPTTIPLHLIPANYVIALDAV